MSWSRWVSCFAPDPRRGPRALATLLVVLGGSTLSCTSEPSLQVVGESVKLKQGEALPRHSALFDGRRMTLRGARGETLGVQVLLDASRPEPVRLDLPSQAARVEGFRVDHLNVKEPSTEMYGESRGPGRYPDVLTPAELPVVSQEQVYFDVAIELAAPPGEYLGVLSVGDRTYPVELTVDHVRLELQNDPLVWVFYLPKEIARVHGLPDDDGPSELALETEYHELFRRHGAYLAADLGPDRFGPRRRFAEGLRYWPVAVDASSDERITADVQRWLDIFSGTETTPFAIPIDEPSTPEARERARHIAEVIGRAGGGRPRFLRAVTDAVSPLYADVFDVYFSPHNLPNVAQSRRPRGERFWTYNGKPPGAGSMIIDTDGVALRTWGWIAYRYGVELWYAWEGLYFSDRYNDKQPTDVFTDPVTFDERHGKSSDFGNGDGLLAYPGPRPSLRLKALRRGLQDRLLLVRLAECGGAEQASRIAHRMVPRALGEATGTASWSGDERVWERARLELLDAIARRCDDDG